MGRRSTSACGYSTRSRGTSANGKRSAGARGSRSPVAHGRSPLPPQDGDPRADGVVRHQGGGQQGVADDPGAAGDRADRPVRVRKDDVLASAQPDERSHPHLSPPGGDSPGWDVGARRPPERGRSPAAGGNGVPEVESVPQVDLRERRLRAEGGRGKGQARAPAEGGEIAEERGAVGGGEGSPQRQRAGALRRTAAAAVYRPGAGGGAGGVVDG